MGSASMSAQDLVPARRVAASSNHRTYSPHFYKAVAVGALGNSIDY